MGEHRDERCITGVVSATHWVAYSALGSRSGVGCLSRLSASSPGSLWHPPRDHRVRDLDRCAFRLEPRRIYIIYHRDRRVSILCVRVTEISKRSAHVDAVSATCSCTSSANVWLPGAPAPGSGVCYARAPAATRRRTRRLRRASLQRMGLARRYGPRGP